MDYDPPDDISVGFEEQTVVGVMFFTFTVYRPRNCGIIVISDITLKGEVRVLWD